MPADENNASAHTGQKRSGALQLGARKKVYVVTVAIMVSKFESTDLYLSCSGGTDPLVHHGRHFGRTVHALCTVSALLNNSILRMGELAEQPEETFTHE
jgi:hypothetical protein